MSGTPAYAHSSQSACLACPRPAAPRLFHPTALACHRWQLYHAPLAVGPKRCTVFTSYAALHMASHGCHDVRKCCWLHTLLAGPLATYCFTGRVPPQHLKSALHHLLHHSSATHSRRLHHHVEKLQGVTQAPYVYGTICSCLPATTTLRSNHTPHGRRGSAAMKGHSRPCA